MRLLISKGAEVNKKTTKQYSKYEAGLTPLDLAIIGNRTEVISVLREHGGEVSDKRRRELEKFKTTTD